MNNISEFFQYIVNDFDSMIDDCTQVRTLVNVPIISLWKKFKISFRKYQSEK